MGYFSLTEHIVYFESLLKVVSLKSNTKVRVQGKVEFNCQSIQAWILCVIASCSELTKYCVAGSNTLNG